MMMSKRGVGPFSVIWYTGQPGGTRIVNRLNKKQPQAPALVPSVWCQDNMIVSKVKFSKNIAEERRQICPEPSRLDQQRKYSGSFGISYGRG